MTRTRSNLLFSALVLAGTGAVVLSAQGPSLEPTTPRDRWQYLQLAPSSTIRSIDVDGPRGAFQARQPRTGEWQCREFTEGDRTDPLADALQSLGAEGWELVSATALPFDRSVDSAGLSSVGCPTAETQAR